MVDNVNDYGVAYVLTNSVMPDLVKIGMTTRDNVEMRMKESYSINVPVQFECKQPIRLKKNDYLYYGTV